MSISNVYYNSINSRINNRVRPQQRPLLILKSSNYPLRIRKRPYIIMLCMLRALSSIISRNVNTLRSARRQYISMSGSAVRTGCRQSIPSGNYRELRCRQRYTSILRLGPDETTAFQAFCHQSQSASIPPQQLEQIAPPPAKDEDFTAQRIARQRVLYQSTQTREPFAYVGRPRCQPNARA
jgi:hypothetical protein